MTNPLINLSLRILDALEDLAVQELTAQGLVSPLDLPRRGRRPRLPAANAPTTGSAVALATTVAETTNLEWSSIPLNGFQQLPSRLAARPPGRNKPSRAVLGRPKPAGQ